MDKQGDMGGLYLGASGFLHFWVPIRRLIRMIVF